MVNWNTYYPPRRVVPGLLLEVELSTEEYNKLCQAVIELDDYQSYMDSLVREQAEIQGGNSEIAVERSRERRRFCTFLRAFIFDWLSKNSSSNSDASIAGVLVDYKLGK